MEARIIPRADHPISRRQIDSDALKVLYRLHRHGRIAYLVGGGVRDLLLGREPKDFDVVTDAHPGEVKKLFRNSWIIGRRFRLVHVVFGSHRNVVEVATFRAKSEIEPPVAGKAVAGKKAGGKGQKEEPDSRLLITLENTFGTPEDDARRRDLSINGLFYDIADYSIIDFVGGLEDLKRRLIRTIGDPAVRFQEDPVRMMRAVKFAARLSFDIEKKTLAAMTQHAAAITLSAAPRVLEEIYRLLASGCALESFRLLQSTGLLQHLIPELNQQAGKRGGPFWSGLKELDQLLAAGESVARPVLMGVLLDGLVRELILAQAPTGMSLGDQIQEILRPIAQRLRMTRADTARVIQMLVAQRRLLHPRGRSFSVKAFVRRGYFPGAFQLMRINAQVAGQQEDAVQRWEERIRSVEEGGDSVSSDGAEAPAGKSRRRRRRRRRAPRT
jgi:poly(A) polymerase